MNNHWQSFRFLGISLILSVVVASASLGFFFNYVYDHFTAQDQNESRSYHERFIFALAITLERTDSPGEVLRMLQDAGYAINMTSPHDFPLPHELAEHLKNGNVLTLDSEQGLSLHKHLARHDKILSHYLEPENKSTQHVLSLVLTSLFYLALPLILLVWLYPLVYRLIKLRQAAQAFGAGKLNVRIPSGPVSYIADIERDFNNMAQRIEYLIADMKLLSSAVSHDLRTPLARIRFGVETLAEEHDPMLRADFQKRVIRDVDNMVDLVEHLLDYARIEQKLLEGERTAVDLKAMVKSAVEMFKLAGNKTLKSHLPDQACHVFADSTFINIIINNLLDNALKFSREHVLISVIDGDTTLSLIVEDDGPGINVEQRADVVKPFIRAHEKKRNEGFGLGLAIVKRVAEFYDAKLEIGRSKELKGAIITVCFEKANVILETKPKP